MRIGTAITAAALGMALSACGSASAPSAMTPSTSTTVTPSSTRVAEPTWTRLTDPSGASFMFPAGARPTLSGKGASTTRTYIADAGSGVVASIVIVPTPVALNVRNFFVQYPIMLRAQGDTAIAPGAVTPLTVQGFPGFRTEVRYQAPPGPSPVYEQREAIQLPKYFVVISAVVSNPKGLSSVEITRARALNTRLLRGFSGGASTR